jgi:tetrahydromethanopterin S-methyltransferase subunit A
MDQKHRSEPADPLPNNRTVLQRLMRGLGRLLPADEGSENARAVTLFHRLDALRDVLMAGPFRRALARLGGKAAWPVTPGAYVVTDPTAPVAICTLTSPEITASAAALPGVAIAGRIYTPNLGIEKIILNVTSNPAIRFLLLCGRESPIFHPGQALQALFRDGVDADQRIIGATGHLPVLRNITPERVAAFVRQVELVDCTGEMDLTVLEARVRSLAARSPGAFAERLEDTHAQHNSALAERGQDAAQFTPIRPGGRREPLAYDPKGFFVITLDRPAREIVLRHYLPDTTPQHLMRGHSAEAMLLGLLRTDVVSQLSHAGYLGAELAKAEAALRLNLHYEQDQPLRAM